MGGAKRNGQEIGDERLTRGWGTSKTQVKAIPSYHDIGNKDKQMRKTEERERTTVAAAYHATPAQYGSPQHFHREKTEQKSRYRSPWMKKVQNNLT
jgi:hypothetical protein